MVVMGNIEEFEYGMSLRYYAKRRIFMLQRDGLPDFGFPLTTQENFLINPHTLQELWRGPRRIFVLVDECAPEDYLEDAVTLETRNGKRLISNHSFLANQTLNINKIPMLLEKN
jgi:hypothetical protein